MPIIDNPVVPAKDFLDRQIEVGHTIVYPIRRGSKMWMQKASVTQIIQHDRTQPPLLTCLNPTGRKVTIQNLDNCVVIGD
ncbi:MAG: hypothetical protein JW818_01505 [Pirellulales bacterium]|nr:hypothetical protein [Pirellulales bacterium]